MLLKYRSDYQKIAMGILSLDPVFKDWDLLQHALAWYQTSDDRTLYLWKDRRDDFAGILGTEQQGRYVVVRLLTLMPDKQTTRNAQNMLDDLAATVPQQRVMGTLANAKIIAEWEYQHGQDHDGRSTADSSQ